MAFDPQLGLAVAGQAAPVDDHSGRPTNADPAASIGLAGEALEYGIPDIVVGVYAIDLKAADGQIADVNVVDVIDGDAGLQYALLQVVVAGQLAGLHAEIDVSLPQGPFERG